MQFEITKEYILEIEEAVAQKNDVFLNETLSHLHFADINSILDELDTEDAKYIMDLLDVSIGAEILVELEEDIRAKFLHNFTPQELADYIEKMDSDDAADILNEQKIRVRENVLSLLKDEEKASNIMDLLRYDEDTAGGLMAKEFIVAKDHWTVNQTIEEIRRQKEKVEKIYSVYVVDAFDHLVGRISLKRLVLADEDSRIKEIVEDNVIKVDAFMKEEDVAHIMSKYDLIAVPVVNIQNKLIGRITIDDVVDVITEQAELDQQAMSGISENVESSDSVWTLSRARLPWLLVGMVGGLLGAQFIGLYSDDLAAIPAMAFFIPLITATGGNVGIQSSTIVVQSLAANDGLTESFLKQIIKSFFGAIINGVAISTCVFGFNYLMTDKMELSAVVALSLFSVVLLASFTGTVTPYVLDKVGVNPALASGPFITTSNDLLGIAVYFSVAHLLLY